MELHSDKAFGKILEHHHICEALIDLFEFFFDNTILSFEARGILVPSRWYFWDEELDGLDQCIGDLSRIKKHFQS